jgi:hypothetical protein
MVDFATETGEWGSTPRRQNVEYGKPRDEVDRLLEDPRYAQVGQDVIKLATFFSKEPWNKKRLLDMQGKLVHDLAAMPDWGEEDIAALAKIKGKYIDNETFDKGFASKQRKKGMNPSVWWAGFVGEAVFMRSWSSKAGLYIADRGEMNKTADHDPELDNAGIDFVTSVDYSDNFEQDTENQLFISFKTRSDMVPGSIKIVEFTPDALDRSIRRYFTDEHPPEELAGTVEQYSNPDASVRTLFVMVGRGGDGDWRQMMRAGNSQDFAMEMADKMDEVIRNEDAYTPDFMGDQGTSARWWEGLSDDEPVKSGVGKKVPVNEKGQKAYKEFSKQFNTSYDNEEEN